ncbi:MAG TPA: hypothetical protein VGX25_35295 [Actinophytocola sp.]|uniref:hypothetical protein n=1 Tax=Actinophytocola sp. TaxID=1872138 RepID=UPI002DDDB2F7|nr:hypothetical protein [Actinophytocola sp.]HEV2784680.1 hypothetical protein [Actinophytocola sp.]
MSMPKIHPDPPSDPALAEYVPPKRTVPTSLAYALEGVRRLVLTSRLVVAARDRLPVSRRWAEKQLAEHTQMLMLVLDLRTAQRDDLPAPRPTLRVIQGGA